MNGLLTFISILDAWIIAIIVGLLVVRERKQKPIVEVSKIPDEEIPLHVERRTHAKVAWRPINPLLNQRKENYLYPLSVFNPKNRKWLLWALVMFIIIVIVGLNGGKPLTP